MESNLDRGLLGHSTSSRLVTPLARRLKYTIDSVPIPRRPRLDSAAARVGSQPRESEPGHCGRQHVHG